MEMEMGKVKTHRVSTSLSQFSIPNRGPRSDFYFWYREITLTAFRFSLGLTRARAELIGAHEPYIFPIHIIDYGETRSGGTPQKEFYINSSDSLLVYRAKCVSWQL